MRLLVSAVFCLLFLLIPVLPERIQDQNIPNVDVIDPPSYVTHGQVVKVSYKCLTLDSVLGLELVALTADLAKIVFRKIWNCEDTHQPLQLHRRSVKIKLPRYIAYKPSIFNKYSVYVNKGKLQAWIANVDLHKKCREDKSCFKIADVRFSTDVGLLEPYDRPERPIERCFYEFIRPSELNYPAVCPFETDECRVISFPVILTGGEFGLHRKLPVFRNALLERERRQSFTHPRFSIYILLYIEEYTPEGTGFGSILQHITWDKLYATPIIFVTWEGILHTEFVTEDGELLAFTAMSIPRHRWCKLLVSFENAKWLVQVSCEPDFSSVQSAYYRVGSKFVYFDDTLGNLVFGGTERRGSFRGYIAEATVYRRRVVTLNQIEKTGIFSIIHEMNLSQRPQFCREHLAWVQHYEFASKLLLQRIIDKKSCKSDVHFWRAKPIRQKARICRPYAVPVDAEYMMARDVIRRNMDSHGLKIIPNVITQIRQASCYGNDDATYMLASVRSSGIGVKAFQQEAASYLSHCAFHRHRLCLLALASRFSLGSYSYPRDLEHSYVYYKEVAHWTKRDRELHSHDGVMTEKVRLTDEARIQQQTSEDEDLFHWLNHQAKRGVKSAQSYLAELMYWGSGGIKRNIEAAVDYYRQLAENDDAKGRYDYGIVLLKGHGVTQNESHAKEQFERAAELGSDKSMNTLGWYAFEREHDFVKAEELWQRAYSLGNPDAAHNLGHMYATGKNAQGIIDWGKAYHYYLYAGPREQFDSAIELAKFYARGQPDAGRNPDLAMQWARFIAEQNIEIGKVLRKGLKSFRNQNWSSALLYYHLAADTGLEVASFNTAYMCDEDREGLTAYIEEECIFRYFNLSLMRPERQTHAYAWLRTGDFYWYGYRQQRNTTEAVLRYARAAQKSDARGFYDLAYCIEEGEEVPQRILRSLLQNDKINWNNSFAVLTALYQKCLELQTEGEAPCQMALWRVQALQIWQEYKTLLRCSTVISVTVAVGAVFTAVYAYLSHHLLPVNTL